MDDVFKGYAPVVATQAGNPEAEKYGKLWGMPAYRHVSPGEQAAKIFLDIALPKRGAFALDLGCGTGRGAVQLVLGGMNVTMVDFVRNSLDPHVRKMMDTGEQPLRFVKADLEHPLPVTAEYGFNADCMEHIPPDRVDRVLDNCLMACQHVFFHISTTPDACGALIGETLHLSVHPYAWWLEKFTARECTVHWSHDAGDACLFYVSAWQNAKQVVDVGKLNVEDQQIRTNVAHNIAQGWEQVTPHETTETEVMILGGGPSMAAFEDEMKRKRAEGVKLITLNGAYNWALAHGMIPSAQIVVDARPHNARFTRPVVDECKYLIGSQVDPAVLEGLPRDRTWLWHTSADTIEDLLRAQYETSYPIPGGSTVLLRAIPLLRTLGFAKFHLYGCDSCLTDAAHHAYAQPENDGATVVSVSVTGGRIFRCHPWMAAQAQEFIDMIRMIGDEIEVSIAGDGLLAHILNTGAELLDERESAEAV